MNKAWLVALTLFLMLYTHSVFAIKVESLYQADVLVNSQSAEERTHAIQNALGQVLIKVSGNSQIMANPNIKSRLLSAGSLVQEFSYSNAKTSDPLYPYRLQIRFEANGVNQWLRDGSAPIWGQNRPLILAWIQHEVTGQPAEILSNQPNAIAETIKQAATNRGIPLMFPTLDVTDLNKVSVEDIKSMAVPNLAIASKRYNNAALLVGQINEDASGLTSQWKLVMGLDQWDWTISGKNLLDIIPNVIDHVTTTLAGRYAVVTTNTIQKNITLKVIGITKQNDFVQLIRYLNHLTPVADVGILRISGNEIMLNVSLRSTQDAFIQAVSIGQQLLPLTNDQDPLALNYQWKD